MSRYMTSKTYKVPSLNRGVVVYEDLYIEGKKVVVGGLYVKVSSAMSLLDKIHYDNMGSVNYLSKMGLEGEYITYSQLRGDYIATYTDLFYKLSDVQAVNRGIYNRWLK